jgi:hypothetical protein
MSFTYIIQDLDEKEVYEPGHYLATLKSIEEKMDEKGSYVEIAEEFLDPGPYKGKIDRTRFYIGHEDSIKKSKAVWAFNKFCKSLVQLNNGEVMTDAHIVNKKYVKVIDHKVSPKGTTYSVTVDRILTPLASTIGNFIQQNQSAAPVQAVQYVAPVQSQPIDQTMAYGKINIPQQSTQNNQAMNAIKDDEVPF